MKRFITHRRAWAMLVAALSTLALATPAAFATHDTTGVPYVIGDVFAGIGTYGEIHHFSNTGALKHTINTIPPAGNTDVVGMCFDASNNLYAANFITPGNPFMGSMTKFNNVGNLLGTYPWATGFNTHPESCVVNQAGDVYVGSVDPGDLRKFTPGGTLITTYNPSSVGGRGVDWIDLTADQCTIYYASESTEVRRFSVGGAGCPPVGQLTPFATGLTGPCYALRILANGEVLVACASKVYRLNSLGGIMQTYPGAGLTPPASGLFGLNLDPDLTSFWTADLYADNIYRIDIASGTQIGSSFASGAGDALTGGLAIFGEPHQLPPPPPPDPETVLDHFKCYDVTRSNFVKFSGVQLTDQFGVQTNVHVVRPDLLCNPTDKIHGTHTRNRLHPTLHLVCYWITPRTSIHQPLLVFNQFTGQPPDYLPGEDWNAFLSHYLCVPSFKSLAGPPPPWPLPPQPQPPLDHFKCYYANGPLRSETVQLRDQFSDPNFVSDLARISQFICNPVEKQDQNGVFPRQFPTAHLACDTINQPATTPRQVFVSNQFGEQVLTVTRPHYLCLPSLKQLPTYTIVQKPPGQPIIPGVTDIGNHCDDCTTTIAPPFPVIIYGKPCTSLTVSSNGNVQCGTANSGFSNVCLPEPGFGEMVAPHHDDLRTDNFTGGNPPEGVFTDTVPPSGTNRQFIVEWRAEYFTGGAYLNFELIFNQAPALHSNAHFEMRYGAIPNAGVSATVGVQASSTGPSTSYECNGVPTGVGPGLALNYVWG